MKEKKNSRSRKTKNPNKSIPVMRSFTQDTLNLLALLQAHYGLPSQSSTITFLAMKESKQLIKAGLLEAPAPTSSPA